MKVWYLPAVLALAIAHGSTAAAGQSVEELVDIFRQGCLDHLPNFAGSEGAFQELGFAQFSNDDGDKILKKVVSEQTILAGLSLNGGEPFGTCFLNIELPPEAVITPVIANMFADRTQNKFRQTGIERGGQRLETFLWRMGSLDALVVLYPDKAGSRSLSATVGEIEE